ncbi:hypothetical protein [Pedobacter sp.]|uniref:hypothetical protein n=1 Tax=Pedobacter sp. TaxID=1411316 RepID=UPI00396C9F1F
MKKQTLILLATTLPFMFSCQQSGNGNKAESKKTVLDTVKQCYTAGYEKDSAFLKLKITDTVNVLGDLTINYENKPANVGTVQGKFKGDTLYVDYTYKIGENDKATYANPLAFLKKDGKLFMGVGQIETAYGRSYFVKGKPINFERGKFTFEEKTCK